jgi:hypothetical protein
MRGMAVAVVYVVDVVAVRHRGVPAVFAVLVIVVIVDAVLGWLALVPMPVVGAVQVTVVQVVDVVAMRDDGVTAALAVGVAVLGVLGVCLLGG